MCVCACFDAVGCVCMGWATWCVCVCVYEVACVPVSRTLLDCQDLKLHDIPNPNTGHHSQCQRPNELWCLCTCVC